MNKAKEKKICLGSTSPTLFDAKGDMAKEWYVYYYENGKRIRIKGNLNRLKVASERYALAKEIIESITALPPVPIDNEVLDYLKKRENIALSTLRNYKGKLSLFCEFLGGASPNNENVGSFFSYLLSVRKIENKTYNEYLILIKSFLSEYYTNIEITANCKKVESEGAMYFSAAQMKRIKVATTKESESLWLLIQLMYYCFLRPRSEIRLLKFSDIDFEKKIIVLPSDIAKNRTRQIIPIPGAFFPELEKYRDREGYVIGTNGIGSQNATGKNWSYVKFSKILRGLGIVGSGYCLYSVRNTAAVDSILSGVSIFTLSKRMRHHSVTQTEEYLRRLGIAELSNEVQPTI